MRNFTGHLLTASECRYEISRKEMSGNIDDVISNWLTKQRRDEANGKPI